MNSIKRRRKVVRLSPSIENDLSLPAHLQLIKKVAEQPCLLARYNIWGLDKCRDKCIYRHAVTVFIPIKFNHSSSKLIFILNIVFMRSSVPLTLCILGSSETSSL